MSQVRDRRGSGQRGKTRVVRGPGARRHAPENPLYMLLPGLVAAAVLLGAGCARGNMEQSPPAGAGAASAASSPARVQNGIDVLVAEQGRPLAGKRVALLTNHTGLTSAGGSTIDALNALPGVRLLALFGPEHGIRGTAAEGATVASSRDPKTGLPVYSLYGGDAAQELQKGLTGVDAVLIDIQDIGTRYYTYDWTSMRVMDAAAKRGIEVYVLDRPDPIGGDRLQGNVLDPRFQTDVGGRPVPMAFGMTLGELASYVNAEFNIGAKLHVIRMSGWRHGMWYDATGLRWVAPSPNMPDIESAASYPGTCLFEGTNVSVGRGTPHAFAQIGAPWIDGEALAARLNARKLPGMRFEAVSFTPRGGQVYGDTLVHGVRFVVTDRSVYDAAVAGVAAVLDIRALAPQFRISIPRHFDRLAGTDLVRKQIEAGASLEEITRDWPAQRQAFDQVRKKYLLYP